MVNISSLTQLNMQLHCLLVLKILLRHRSPQASMNEREKKTHSASRHKQMSQGICGDTMVLCASLGCIWDYFLALGEGREPDPSLTWCCSWKCAGWWSRNVVFRGGFNKLMQPLKWKKERKMTVKNVTSLVCTSERFVYLNKHFFAFGRHCSVDSFCNYYHIYHVNLLLEISWIVISNENETYI